MRVSCPSCQTALNVPDHLAGKKVKCPKCATVVPIPAPAAEDAEIVEATAADNVTAKAPPAKAPPAKAKKGPPPVPTADRDDGDDQPLPLLSYEELKIPPRIKSRIEDAVGDERIVWMGRVHPESLVRKARLGMAFGIPLFVLGLVMLVGFGYGATKMNDKAGRVIMWVLAGVMGGGLTLMSLPMAIMVYLTRKYMHNRECYIITDKHAFVVGYLTRKVFGREELKTRALWAGKDGIGNIVMGFDTTSHFDKNMDETTRSQRIGFLDLADVKQVDRLLRRALKLGPPESVQED